MPIVPASMRQDTARLGVPGVGWKPDIGGDVVDYYVTEAHVRIVRRATTEDLSPGHSPEDYIRDQVALTSAVAALAAKYGTGGTNVAEFPQDEFALVVADHVGGWYVQPETPKLPPQQGQLGE